jgi:tetratricopeptide (TPR) repeat protein
VGAAVFCVALGTEPAAAQRAPSFDSVVAKAGEAREAGRLDEAARHYKKALSLKPEWLEGHWALATLLYDLGRYPEALGHFQKVAAARPEDGRGLAFLGLCEARLEDYERALADLTRASELGIADAGVRSLIALETALLVNRSGNHDGAFEMLRGFAGHGQDSPGVLTAFGLSVLRRPWMPDQIPPDKREMVLLAGRTGYHMARGRRTAVGRLAVEELVSRFPAEPNVHYAFGSYVAPEEPEAAIEAFRRELRATPDHAPALVQIASLELRRGNAEAALGAAEQAVRLSPEMPAARLVLGRGLFEQGETERAVAELEKGAALAPRSAEIQFALARAYQRAGRAEDAERARERFRRLRGDAREPKEGSDEGR